MGFEDLNNKPIRFEPLQEPSHRGHPNADEALVLVPIVPAGYLTPFELPVQGSQIANILRNESCNMSLDQARELVNLLTPQLSADPGGMAQLFYRTWQKYDPTVGQTVEWQLQMSSSLYDPDVVFAARLEPARVLVSETISLSNDYVTTCLAHFGQDNTPENLFLRLAPGASLSFTSGFLVTHSMQLLNSEARLSDDWSFFGSVCVFFDRATGENRYSLPRFPTGVSRDPQKSSRSEAAIFGIRDKETRWDVAIFNCSDCVKISNTGTVPLKVRITSSEHQISSGEHEFTI